MPSAASARDVAIGYDADQAIVIAYRQRTNIEALHSRCRFLNGCGRRVHSGRAVITSRTVMAFPPSGVPEYFKRDRAAVAPGGRFGAVGTAIDPVVLLDAVADNAAAAMRTFKQRRRGSLASNDRTCGPSRPR